MKVDNKWILDNSFSESFDSENENYDVIPALNSSN
jgi:hypothetical protein